MGSMKSIRLPRDHTAVAVHVKGSMQHAIFVNVYSYYHYHLGLLLLYSLFVRYTIISFIYV